MLYRVKEEIISNTDMKEKKYFLFHDKERDREREKERDRDRKRMREKEGERERERDRKGLHCDRKENVKKDNKGTIFFQFQYDH